MQLEITNSAELQAATQALCLLLEEYAVPREKAFDCRLIVNELVGNELPHSQASATLTVAVRGRQITLCVRSAQAFFPPLESVCPPDTAEHGRGLFLVDSVSRSRTVSSDGEIQVIVEY